MSVEEDTFENLVVVEPKPIEVNEDGNALKNENDGSSSMDEKQAIVPDLKEDEPPVDPLREEKKEEQIDHGDHVACEAKTTTAAEEAAQAASLGKEKEITSSTSQEAKLEPMASSTEEETATDDDFVVGDAIAPDIIAEEKEPGSAEGEAVELTISQVESAIENEEPNSPQDEKEGNDTPAPRVSNEQESQTVSSGNDADADAPRSATGIEEAETSVAAPLTVVTDASTLECAIQEPLDADEGKNQSNPEPTTEDNLADETMKGRGLEKDYSVVSPKLTADSTLVADPFSRETETVMEEMEEAICTAESLSAGEEEDSLGEDCHGSVRDAPRVSSPALLEEQEDGSGVKREDAVELTNESTASVQVDKSNEDREVSATGGLHEAVECELNSKADEDLIPEDGNQVSDSLAPATTATIAEKPPTSGTVEEEETSSIEIEIVPVENHGEKNDRLSGDSDRDVEVQILEPQDEDRGLHESEEKSMATEESVETELDDDLMAKELDSPKPDPDGEKHAINEISEPETSSKPREEIIAAKEIESEPLPVEKTAHGKGTIIEQREKMLMTDARKNLKPAGSMTDTAAIGKGSVIKEREAMLLADARKKLKEPGTTDVPSAKGMTIKEREEMLRNSARRSSQGSARSNDSNELSAVTPKNLVKDREQMLKTADTRQQQKQLEIHPSTGKTIKEREEMLRNSARRASESYRSNETKPNQTKSLVAEREEMLKADMQKVAAEKKASERRRASDSGFNNGKGGGVAEREQMLKADMLKVAAEKKASERRRASDGARYGKGGGLSIDTEFNSFQGVKDQIASINERCVKKPPSSKTPGSIDSTKNPPRRASTGEIVRNATASIAAANRPTPVSSLPPRPSSGANKTLLKTYNPDLYYANEFNRLVDVDPADTSKAEGIDFKEVLKIVEAYPGSCKAKYDLTFKGEKLKLYPLFSLVANKAPLEIIEAVYQENPFRCDDVRDEAGQTLMHYACAYNPLSIEALKYLEKRSSHTLDAWDHKKRAPLHTACINMNEEVVLFILEHSSKEIAATPDIDGNLPVTLAMSNPKCSKTVLQALRAKAKGVSPIEEDSPKPIPEPVNKRSPVQQDNNPTANSNPASPLSPSPNNKISTETVGPHSWWERFCCVPRV